VGHPFHVVDDDTVVLSLDHPFVKEGRFASLVVGDRELADSLAEGFHEPWRKAMKNLREIQSTREAANPEQRFTICGLVVVLGIEGIRRQSCSIHLNKIAASDLKRLGDVSQSLR
jgi:hypothetical protein